MRQVQSGMFVILGLALLVALIAALGVLCIRVLRKVVRTLWPHS